MKKLALILLTPLMLSGLAGCNNNSITRLTYGTYLTTEDPSNTDAVEIDYSDLKLKMDFTSKQFGENFILVTYATNGCVCWNKFQPILKQFIKESHYLVYQIKVTELENAENKYNLTFKQGNVALAIIKGNTIISQYLDSEIFDNITALKAELAKHIAAPQMYYVNENQLNDKIKNGENLLAHYVRNGCGDCSYASPKAVWPYVHQNELKVPMYVIDMQDMWQASRDDPSNTHYQEFKDNFNLSTKRNEQFGYGNGVVPTIQYYERGELKGATVYFNDTIAKVDDKYVVLESYYTKARLSYLKYLSGVENNILENRILNEEEVETFQYEGKTYYSWKQDAANEAHYPLFEAFMDFYAKK